MVGTSFFIVAALRAFLPLALIGASGVAIFSPDAATRPLKRLVGAMAIGVLSGSILSFLGRATGFRFEFAGALLLLGILATLAFLFLVGGKKQVSPPSRRPRLLSGWVGYIGLLSAIFSQNFSARLVHHPLSATLVLNAELLHNVGGILLGIALLLALLGVFTYLLAALRPFVARLSLFLSAGLALVPWSGELTLAAMKAEVLGVRPFFVSFVAKTAAFTPFVAYGELLLAGVLAIAFYEQGRGLPRGDRSGSAIDRKSRQAVALRRNAIAWAGAIGIAMATFLLYFDLYASRAPTLSEPVPLVADSTGLIRIAIDEVNDGELHRFSTPVPSGEAVRFFLIRQTREDRAEAAIAVAFDTCQICTKTGYIKEGDYVVCIACLSHLLIPSIGRGGGCNPIPLPHTVEGGVVAIAVENLEKGAKYFRD